MTSDEYVLSIVKKYKVSDEIDITTQRSVISPLLEFIRSWAGNYLNDVQLSGSRAKGTAINISSDLDLFISLISDTPGTYKEIYDALYDEIIRQGITARRQNVSIGIEYVGHKIDLVPARKHTGNTNYHNLYRSKVDSWTQTNVANHINLVRNSGRTNEIVALKVWRKLHQLDFPSIYLELIVLDALSGKSKSEPANNFLTVLDYLRDNFVDKTVIDPSNTNNTISDDLYNYEKQAIAKKAKESRLQQYWGSIIW